MKFKDLKKKYLTEVATELFLKNTISEVTVKDIAEAADVGEATIYRYFENKSNIVKTCALSLQNKVYSDYFAIAGQNGYEKISRFYNVYLEIFTRHPDFFKFISDFDAYAVSEKGISLEEYSEGLDLFKNAFFQAYNEGIADGSVREIPDAELFYYTTALSLITLCKKLASGRIVKQDELFSAPEKVQQLIDIILFSVKK